MTKKTKLGVEWVQDPDIKVIANERAGDYGKYPKSLANYQLGHSQGFAQMHQKCGYCANFQMGSDREAQHSCRKVRGPIRRSFTCRFWRSAK